MTTVQKAFARVRGPQLLGLPYVVFTFVVLLVPMGVLAVYSFWEAGYLTVERNFTFDTYTELLGSSSFWQLLFRSLGVGLASATLITVLAFTVCHGIVFRFGRWKFVLLGVVVAGSLASFIGRVLAAQSLLGNGGVINELLISSGLISEPVELLAFGYSTIVLTLSYIWMPTGALIVFGALQDVDYKTMEASHDLGAGRWATLRLVTIPQATAGIKACFALMFIVSTADYVTPSLVGGTKGSLVASQIQSTFLSEGNLPRGSAMAFVLVVAMVVGVGAVFVALRIVGAVLAAIAGGATDSRSNPRKARKYLYPGSLSYAASIPVLIMLVVPLVTIFVFSLNSAPVIGLPFAGITTDWYSRIVSTPGFSDALQTSLILVVLDVAGSLALGIMLAFAMRQRFKRGLLYAILPIAVAAPIVVPRTVIGVSYFTSTALFEMPLGVAPTVIAQILLSAPFVGIVLSLRLSSIDPHLSEAARDLGASPWRQMWNVTLPIIVPSVIGVGFMVAAFSLDEILVTTFTIGANSTLPVWMLSQTRHGINPGINALAVMLLVGTIVLFALASLSMLASRTRARRLAKR